MITRIALPYPASSIELFRNLRHLPLPVLLHSGSNGGSNSRFDIMSAAPEVILRGDKTATIVSRRGSPERVVGEPLELLEQEMQKAGFGEVEAEDALPFSGGALGYFAYDLLHESTTSAGDIDLPAMLIGIYHWALIVDHEARSMTLLRRDTCGSSEEMLLQTVLKSPPATAPAFILESDFKSNFSKQQYMSAFHRIMDYIHAGDCYQVNLAQRFSACCSGDSFDAFSILQARAQAPFAAYIEDGDQAVLSFSPERFLKVRDRHAVTQPIKGTRRRYIDEASDQRAAAELANSAKDRAENLMIVDLLRNDLGRVCKTGSIRAKDLFSIESFANVHHMVSSISGELEEIRQIFDLLGACFPGGSITGTPKSRAMEIIAELESVPRSVYCGSFGYVSLDGSMDSNICIRTLVRDRHMIHCWGGGGIVADSDGDLEYQETMDKINMFINGL